MARALFVLVYLVPFFVLLIRFWPWNKTNPSAPVFLGIGLGGVTILYVLSVLVLPRILVKSGATTELAQRLRYAARAAIPGPLLLVVYLTASNFIHSIAALLLTYVGLGLL